ncbi:MAG TPA: MoaD/ThiS family protein [Anaerolineae bacterium]|nr:MoaD/ThiS family protein [Anaerolineae bacterium]
MIKVTYRDKKWEVPGRITVRDLIVKVGLNPETILAVKNGKLINDGTLLGDEDDIRLIAVISGG